MYSENRQKRGKKYAVALYLPLFGMCDLLVFPENEESIKRHDRNRFDPSNPFHFVYKILKNYLSPRNTNDKIPIYQKVASSKVHR